MSCLLTERERERDINNSRERERERKDDGGGREYDGGGIIGKVTNIEGERE